MRVGVEVGGTFTDLVAVGPDGIRVTKVPSVPAAPDEGAFNALVSAELDLGAVEDLAHGSTIATNAVLERKGAKVAFVTTKGFRDILIMQRHSRSRVYDLTYQKPEPVVRRRDSYEVAERLLADGSVEAALDEQAVVDELIPKLKEGGYEAVAICLVNAYANPAHEEQLAGIIARHCQDMQIACSSAVSREFREYERASTTTLSAYVQPVINRYLERFEDRLNGGGFTGRFSVMQSNGGRLPADGMRRNAITALLSGPAAGVMGAVRQVGRSGFHNLITFDMGGTSTDVCLVTQGQPELTSEFALDGLPIRTPIIDINTVGAGGGSIIWVDDGGMLRAGPQSAGADPGPACYGRGGTEPTITDAHVLRKTLRPDAFLGGRMTIDGAASARAFEPLAERFSMSLQEIADSAIRVADANIVRAMQIISTERGKDPRDYAMVAFGGAGPLHACRIAEDLGVGTVVVPPNAGVLSAYGLIAADYRQFDSTTRKMLVDDATPAAVAEVFEEMRKRAIERFVLMGLGHDPDLTFIADMRFVGQAFEVAVEIDHTALDALTGDTLRQLFAAEHHRVFMHGGDAGNPIEIVAFRLGVTAPLDEIPVLSEETEEAPAPATAWTMWEHGGEHGGQAGSRATMKPGDNLAGPYLLEDTTSTISIPDGWAAELDDHHNLVLTKSP
ncbi:MAG: hydantoinase/oxoprolinase family protein [Pseudomonadota bacterium]